MDDTDDDAAEFNSESTAEINDEYSDFLDELEEDA
jgi:hypothetical protein